VRTRKCREYLVEELDTVQEREIRLNELEFLFSIYVYLWHAIKTIDQLMIEIDSQAAWWYDDMSVCNYFLTSLFKLPWKRNCFKLISFAPHALTVLQCYTL
jgi:hypothetical protein